MIVGDVVLNSPIEFKTIISRVEIDVIILQGLPEPFYPDIIQSTAFAIHRDTNFFLGKVLRPQGTGVLAALVAVYDLRLSIFCNCILQHVLTSLCTHGVTNTPTDDLAAIHVNDGCHIHKAFLHRDIGNIRTPDLIAMGDVQALQQVRLNECLQPTLGQVLASVHRFPAHDPEQAADTLGANGISH